MLPLVPGVFKPWQYFVWQEDAVGCYLRNQTHVLQSAGCWCPLLFLGGGDTSREALRPRGPRSAEQWGDAWADSLLQELHFEGFLH